MKKLLVLLLLILVAYLAWRWWRGSNGAATADRGQSLFYDRVWVDHLPTAQSVPPIESALRETPSPLNPLGAKGVGEGGSIGTPAAVANAVADALAPRGIRHLDMPYTPSRVWTALQRP